MKRLLIILIVLAPFTSQSQTCEDFDPSLFHMLDEDVSNKINCTDTNGLRQGWWIKYRISHNPVYQPDVLDTGIYVASYTYGQYKDDKKIANWKTVENVHQVYEKRIENYYYSNDTTLVTTQFWDGGKNKSIVYYNSDSSIINSQSISAERGDTVDIYCNRQVENFVNSCKMTYRGKLIKTFQHYRFEKEFNNSFLEFYERKKRAIDEKLDGN